MSAMCEVCGGTADYVSSFAGKPPVERVAYCVACDGKLGHRVALVALEKRAGSGPTLSEAEADEINAITSAALAALRAATPEAP